MSGETDWTQRAMCAWAEHRFGLEGVTHVDFDHWCFAGTDVTPGDHSFEVVVQRKGQPPWMAEIDDVPALIRELMGFATMDAIGAVRQAFTGLTG